MMTQIVRKAAVWYHFDTTFEDSSKLTSAAEADHIDGIRGTG